MKTTIAILGLLVLAGPGACAYEDAELAESISAFNKIFDGRGSLGHDDMKIGILPRPLGVAKIADVALSPVTTHFTSLGLSVANPWTFEQTDLSLASDGSAVFTLSRHGRVQEVLRANLSADEMAALRRLWAEAGATTGDTHVGRKVEDASTFKLSAQFCGDADRFCSGGSVSGSMDASAWTDDLAGVKSLVDFLLGVEKRIIAGGVPAR